jgi:hypothetical protein
VKKASKPKRKLRRVVFGVGHPWFYAKVKIGGDYETVGMFLTPAHNVFTDLEAIDSRGLGNWNKIRLVAEVLK